MAVIGWAHTLVHQGGIARIQTDIRIMTRYVTVYLVLLLPFTLSYLHLHTCILYGVTDKTRDHSRTDKVQPMEGHVASVERILAASTA